MEQILLVIVVFGAFFGIIAYGSRNDRLNYELKKVQEAHEAELEELKEKHRIANEPMTPQEEKLYRDIAEAKRKREERKT